MEDNATVKDTQNRATEMEVQDRAAKEKRREQERRENWVLWLDHFERQRESHQRLADEYGQKIESLLNERKIA